jgi:hypothetical protein
VFNARETPQALAVFRGLYDRIAKELDLHPSYVSRVARGERKSKRIEAALQREMNGIRSLSAAD